MFDVCLLDALSLGYRDATVSTDVSEAPQIRFVARRYRRLGCLDSWARIKFLRQLLCSRKGAHPGVKVATATTYR